MDARLLALLADLHSEGVAHDEKKADRLDRLRNLEPDSAQLLALLVRAVSARRVLELGTSNGYSTIWLADAIRATRGQLVSVEVDPVRSGQAEENLRRAGLVSVVELRVEDAARVLAEASDDSWDFIFLDAERPAYKSYWPDLRRIIKSGGLIAIDNVLSHSEQVSDFRTLVEADESFTESVIPTGAGVLLLLRTR